MGYFGFLLYWVLVLYLSFRACVYGTKTGVFSRKIKFVIFACSFASIAAALRRRTFFARTKKVPKKYAEGVRTLSTPEDAVKLRLRFASQVLRRYRKCLNMWKRKKRSLFLHHIDIGLTHRCFLEIFGFWLYWGLALCLSFRAGIYGTKTDTVSRKIIFAIFDYLSAKVEVAHSRRP